MPNLAISLKNAVLSLNGNAGLVDILHSVSIDIVKGETVGLVGPSGSGKSSLLMIMAGLEETTGGSITVLGLDLTKMNENALATFEAKIWE
jgi:putative ABC transport system ATP-binding protein